VALHSLTGVEGAAEPRRWRFVLLQEKLKKLEKKSRRGVGSDSYHGRQKGEGWGEQIPSRMF